MPSTRSSAATKCISDVPGLVKQTSTPPATRVRTRLSAPFIISLPFAARMFPKEPQINHCSARQSKGEAALQPSPREQRPDLANRVWLTESCEDRIALDYPVTTLTGNACCHAGVGCETRLFVACF